MDVIIMRGLPGSGKSSMIERYQKPKVVCSADDYHMVDGVYKYNPKYVTEAHKRCLNKYLFELQNAIADKTVFVDNTNTTLIELAPYARIAEALDIPFKIVYVYCDPVVACSRTIHKVPFLTILKMHKALMLEEVPSWWPMEIVS